MLKTSKRLYELAINLYLCGEIVKKLEQHNFSHIEEIKEILSPVKNVNYSSKWVDIGGMITLRDRINSLTESLIIGKTNTIEKLNKKLRDIYSEGKDIYYSWCIDTLRQTMGIDIKALTKSTLTEIVSIWRNNAVKFNKMILKDAEKEFDQLSRIAFGPDGDANEKLADFESVRGKYEINSFVTGIIKESEAIEDRYSVLLKKIESLTD
jgi:hypothetical protein